MGTDGSTTPARRGLGRRRRDRARGGSRRPGRAVARRCGCRVAGEAAGHDSTITVNVIPIANVLPLDLGIKKGFFEQQGIEVKKTVLQSGNDIVLALANSNGEIGFAGWVPAMIARTQGIPITAVTTSEVEGTSDADNWQNILVKGSSSIRTPADLAGKTIAVNALKGVGEVMIRAALEKAGVDPTLDQAPRRAVPGDAERALATARSTRSGRPSRSCRRP